MRYYEGMDNPSIAQSLEISTNTVKIHLVKARQFLKQHLDVSIDQLVILLIFANII